MNPPSTEPETKRPTLMLLLRQTSSGPPTWITLGYTVVMIVMVSVVEAADGSGLRALNVMASVAGTVIAGLLGWRICQIVQFPAQRHANNALTWLAVGIHLTKDLALALLLTGGLMLWQSFF